MDTTRSNPRPLFTIILVMAMVFSMTIHALATMQGTRVCAQTLRVCEMNAQAVAAELDDGHSCCPKQKDQGPAESKPHPDQPGHTSHCPWCVTVCPPSACVPLVANAGPIFEEPSLFDSLIAPVLPHACDWVSDLFRPPCL